MTGLFIKEILMFEKKLFDGLKVLKEVSMFKCVRLKHLEIYKAKQIEQELEKVMLDGKNRKALVVKNSFNIEDHYDEFFDYNILHSVMKGTQLSQLVQDKIETSRREFYDKIMESKEKMKMPED